MSTFGSLNIAVRGLTAAQKSIDVTGHNIANANTPGYSRQRLEVASVDALISNSRFSQTAKGAVGGGVEIVTVDQVRNPFLDRQFQKENSQYNEWSTRSQGISYIESLFDELNNTGLSRSINEFVESLQEASKNPVNKEYRTHVMQNALKLTETINHYASQLLDMQHNQNETIAISVNRVNTIAVSVSDLNAQIERYELSGQKANDLRDKRNLLLDELSELVPINTFENSKGQIKVVLEGDANYTLIDHVQTYNLNLVKDQENPINGKENDLYSIYWHDSDHPIQIGGGSIKAHMDLRDGDKNTKFGIPYLNSQLDVFVNAITSEFNAIHENSWSIYNEDNGFLSQTGISFFTNFNGDTDNINSLNITVNPFIVQNSLNIALSSEPVLNDYDKGNNISALQYVDLFNRNDIPNIGGFYSFVESFVGELAVEASHSENRLYGQENLLASIDTQRQSISGVSLDEEMSNLIKYQHSYTAAARMITALDEMMDVLVNRTGIIGR